jgi:hypothetical protein
MSSANNLIAAIFDDPDRAQVLVERLIEEDFPMDQVSLLHHAGGEGDDFLGIAYTDEGERIKVWGKHGALWGAVGGLLAGATGLLVIPGVGPLLVAGPLVDIIAGATVGTGVMASAAVVTRLTIALRRMGIPEEKLELLHQAIMDGKTVLILHCGAEDPVVLQQRIKWYGAELVEVLS